VEFLRAGKAGEEVVGKLERGDSLRGKQPTDTKTIKAG
jgi:hypothetical protein